jgi:hypothetical protein
LIVHTILDGNDYLIKKILWHLANSDIVKDANKWSKVTYLWYKFNKADQSHIPHTRMTFDTKNEVDTSETKDGMATSV